MITHTPQAGSGIAEFLIVAIPIVLLGMGGVETASWLNTRQALSLALINAGRAASSQYGKPEVIAANFEKSLHTIYPNAHSLTARLAKNQDDTGIAWQIKILNPTTDTFDDHKSNFKLTATPNQNQPTINNYYQDLQHRNNLKKGWPNGHGQKSGTDVFQANTLQLELTWPLQPILPGIQQIISLLNQLTGLPKGDAQNYHQQVFTAGYLPIKRNISISMQSHPVLWHDLADNRVIYAGENYFNPLKNSNPGSSSNAQEKPCEVLNNNLICSKDVSRSIDHGADNTSNQGNIDNRGGDQKQPDKSSDNWYETPDNEANYCDVAI